MSSAQQQAFTDATSGSVTTTDATNMVAMIVSVMAITWLLIVFLGYFKKTAHREIELIDFLMPMCLSVFVVILVASILFS